MATDYHSQYWAHALTLKSASDSIQNLSRSIANARVDLNPHQIDAALFAFRSPLAKGSILADEVGLGKTIEAGIVIAQRWAEGRRKILLILPASLRKQWQQELEEKFFLPTVVLESWNYNQQCADGQPNAFNQSAKVVACSYHFASAKMDDVRRVRWDLVVIDEAHRLRNVYKTSNKMARNIADATGHAPKLLLTATPLQNSLLELYGLVSIIDPHVFGDLASFREKFVRASDDDRRNTQLRERLKPFCTRTLRKQVLEYIRFTQRVPITQEFLPSDDEHRLYELVSQYLQREVLLALPSRQRMLMTMVLRKLLASSTFAIGSTLRRLVKRLEDLLAEQIVAEEPLDDFENLEEVADEWEDDTEDEPEIEPALIRDELAELLRYADLADGIQQNAKGTALLSALRIAFEKAESLGAKRKAVIFTESRRTQDYLFDLLTQNGYSGKVVLLNGTNTDPHSRGVYERWLERHSGEEVVSGSRAVDTKAAIVEEFRDRATLMIATEAGAEAKDTRGNTQSDDQAYELIMKDKERLLDLNEPLRFIFSHSALREGWDNPNVFQICTLNETKSEIKKRQEIGRGLRLPVREDGTRCFDPAFNRLTFVANEMYEEFARKLQTEIEEECGVEFEGRIANKRERRKALLVPGWRLNPDFQELWERIQHKTRYAVTYSTESLIAKASEAVRKTAVIVAPKLTALRSRMSITEEGVTGELLAVRQMEMEESEHRQIPDLLTYLQRETELTRSTLADILIDSGRLPDVAVNPQQFLDQAVGAIRRTLNQMIIDGIKYEKIDGEVYEMLLFEEKESEAYLSRLVDVQNSIYDCVEVESEVERDFAKAMSQREDIKLFFKLPAWFKVETPIGTYNPDWAIVKQERGQPRRLYLVRETKSTKEQAKLRQAEWDKIRCGQAHFTSLGVDFKHVTGAAEV